jgi:hypothetical protein
VLPDILKPYPNAKGIGINSTAYGEQTNIVTYYFLEGLEQRIETFSGIKDFIRPHLEEGIKNYTFPGEPAPALYELMRKYDQSGGSSSPVSQETSSKGTSTELIDGMINKSVQSSSSPLKPGGIDFRFMPIVTQSMDSLRASIRSLPRNSLQDVNLIKEWSDIERLVSSGIVPSTERLKEYFIASYYKDNLDSDMEKIVSCISDILRQEEESCCSTDPMLKDMLVVLGSGRSGEELKLALAN